MNRFNFFASLFKQASKAANANDIPQLTNFLKSSEVFRSIAWKIHNLKNNAVSKMDDVAFKEDPHNKPQQPHGHGQGSHRGHHNNSRKK